MQTFIPIASSHFAKSAKHLDNKRLGCQRKEAKQICTVLRQGPTTLYRLPAYPGDPEAGYQYGLVPSITPSGYQIRKTPWYNHPAVKMWRGHEWSLACYGADICAEWISRGFKDSLQPFFVEMQGNCAANGVNPNPPSWLGDETFHASHRSNLLRKNPIWYNQFGWNEPSDLPYVWPVE